MPPNSTGRKILLQIQLRFKIDSFLNWEKIQNKKNSRKQNYIIFLFLLIYGTKYSRMDQAKFVENRQPLKNLKGYGLLRQTIPLQIF